VRDSSGDKSHLTRYLFTGISFRFVISLMIYHWDASSEKSWQTLIIIRWTSCATCNDESRLIVSPGIHSPASVVPGFSRRGDAGRPGADPDVPAARADAAEAQGCRFRRYFVSYTAAYSACTISWRISSNKRVLFPPHRAAYAFAGARSCASRENCYPCTTYAVVPHNASAV